jgi:hypothetical protein
MYLVQGLTTDGLPTVKPEPATDTFTSIEIFKGGSGADTLIDGPGSYTFDGGGGTNTVVLNDPFADYSVSHYLESDNHMHTVMVDVLGTSDDGKLDLVNVQNWQYLGQSGFLAYTQNISAGQTGSAVMQITVSGALNGGALQASSGTADSASSQPSITVAAGTSAEIAGPSAKPVAFTGSTGTLRLDDSSSFAGTIAGLGGEDSIDVADVGFGRNSTLGYSANPSLSGGTLSVGAGLHMSNIALLGSYMASTFVAASDGHGGTLISEAAHASGPIPLVAQPHA